VREHRSSNFWRRRLVPASGEIFFPLPLDVAGEKIKRVELIRLLILTQYGKLVGRPFGDHTQPVFSVIWREEIITTATPRSGERHLRIDTPARYACSKRLVLL
jgi:hypothetical protein